MVSYYSYTAVRQPEFYQLLMLSLGHITEVCATPLAYAQQSPVTCFVTA